MSLSFADSKNVNTPKSIQIVKFILKTFRINMAESEIQRSKTSASLIFLFTSVFLGILAILMYRLPKLKQIK